LFVLNAGISYRRGAIARTTDVTYTWGVSGSINVDQSDNFLSVLYVWSPSQVTQGLMVMKTGKTTGTTGGQVINTCVDATSSNDVYVRRCSAFARYYSGDGDSGSPVYQGNSGQAHLIGINWGYAPDDHYSMFSYYANAVSEMGGAFNALTDITLTSSTISGTIVSGTYPRLAWTAVTATNSTFPTTYRLRRRSWNATTQSYTDYDTDVLVTQTVFNQTDFDRPVNLYYGSSYPGTGVSYVEYYIMATNHGVVRVSGSVFYRSRSQLM